MLEENFEDLKDNKMRLNAIAKTNQGENKEIGLIASHDISKKQDIKENCQRATTVENGEGQKKTIESICSEGSKDNESEEFELNPSTRKHYFDKRQDVLNKTLLRSLKKYLTKEFYDYNGLKQIPYKERVARFYDELQKFFDYKYSTLIKDTVGEAEVNPEDIYFYTGIIIWPEMMKKKFKSRHRYIKFNKSFYECVYRYSHVKLSKLFSDVRLRFMFENYIKTGGAKYMIKTDETLNRNPVIYERTVQVFIESFQQGRYINL